MPFKDFLVFYNMDNISKSTSQGNFYHYIIKLSMRHFPSTVISWVAGAAESRLDCLPDKFQPGDKSFVQGNNLPLLQVGEHGRILRADERRHAPTSSES